MNEFDWSPDAVVEMHRLWKRGMSATEIAETLSEKFGGDLTRNSVISKIDRVGIGRQQPSKPRHIKGAIYEAPGVNTHPLELTKNETREFRA